MKLDNFKIHKFSVMFTTHLGCYADDVWVIPLQKDTSIEPEVSENGIVNNHNFPFIEITHSDNELPEVPGKKNPWKVKVMRINEDNDCEIYGSGAFTSSRAALNSPLVQRALEKANMHRMIDMPAYDYMYA